MLATTHGIAAIVPCNDLDASERFYARLGFRRRGAPGEADSPGDYRILHDDFGASVHLSRAVPGWLIPGQNPFGLYLSVEDVDGMARGFGIDIVEKSRGPEHKPWGMYEFSVADPDQTLVRVGRPSRRDAPPAG